jgi:hypothetical protein
MERTRRRLARLFEKHDMGHGDGEDAALQTVFTRNVWIVRAAPKFDQARESSLANAVLDDQHPGTCTGRRMKGN